MSAPLHWNLTELGAVGQVSGGSTPSTQNPDYWGGGIPWVAPSEVSKHPRLHIDRTERTITAAGLANCAARLLPPGTVMMTSRATIGEVVINSVPMATNQGFINVVCDERLVINEFLALWMKQNKQEFIDRAHGVTFKEISKSVFKTIPIYLPPLSEQRAITNILQAVQDARDAHRRELKAERERKAALMEDLFTCGVRGEPCQQTELGLMPQSWEIKRASDVAVRVTDGTHDSPKPSSEGFPLVTSAHLRYGRLDLSATYLISQADYDEANKRSKVDRYDVLFSMIGSIGTVAYVATDPIFAVKNIGLFKSGGNVLLGQWLYWALQSEGVQGYIKARISGTSQKYVPLWLLRDLPLPIPADDERRDIIEALTTSDQKITALETGARLHEELFRAMLDDLMTGRRSALALVE